MHLARCVTCPGSLQPCACPPSATSGNATLPPSVPWSQQGASLACARQGATALWTKWSQGSAPPWDPVSAERRHASPNRRCSGPPCGIPGLLWTEPAECHCCWTP